MTWAAAGGMPSCALESGQQLHVVAIAAEVGVKGGMCIYMKPGRQRDEGCENDDDALRRQPRRANGRKHNAR